MKRFFFFFIFIPFFLLAQGEIDSEEVEFQEHIQIEKYERFNPLTGGDSVRYCGKHKCNGMITDKYENGNILHKGFYTNGILKNGYENFFENGQTERIFRVKSSNRATVKVYYSNAQIRTEAEFFKGEAIFWKDYYPNGNLEYFEEYNKRNTRLITQNFYFQNGQAESITELSDKKSKRYNCSEYYPNGTLREKGYKRHIPQNGGYMKDGSWEIYDEFGKLIKIQNYYRGKEYEED